MEKTLSPGWKKIDIIAKIAASILIPIVILYVGNWLTEQQARIADSRRNTDRITQLIQHLSGENQKERILAIQTLYYHQSVNDLPVEVVESLVTIAATDDVEVAAAAISVLGVEKKPYIEERALILELLGPMMIHFVRTRDYFNVWNRKNTVLATNVIYDSNTAIRNLLVEKAELIPSDLVNDAIKLVEHYDAWLVEYERVKREKDTPYVFVGPKGFPFPKEAERKFIKRYEELIKPR